MGMENDVFRHYMEDGNICQKNVSTTSRVLPRSLAFQAEREMRKTGTVTVRCPECGEQPRVEISPGRVYINCPCGFVRNNEIREPFPYFHD